MPHANEGSLGVLDFVIARMLALGFIRGHSAGTADDAPQTIKDKSFFVRGMGGTKSSPMMAQTDNFDILMLEVVYQQRADYWGVLRQVVTDKSAIESDFLDEWDEANELQGWNIEHKPEAGTITNVMTWQFAFERTW